MTGTGRSIGFARIENIFGTWKRSYGLRRMRRRGLAKVAVQVRFTAIAYNLKRSISILAHQNARASRQACLKLQSVTGDLVAHKLQN
jgi:hypothetical protein